MTSSEKKVHQPQSAYQTLFPTKSTALNPMIKSDLVTSSGVTVHFYLCELPIEFELRKTDLNRFRPIKTMETSIGPNEGNSSSKDESSVPSSIPSVRKFKETPIDGLDSEVQII